MVREAGRGRGRVCDRQGKRNQVSVSARWGGERPGEGTAALPKERKKEGMGEHCM